MTPVTTKDLAARYGDAYKWLVTAAVLLGLTAMVGSATIVNVAMPDIMGEFGLGQDQAQWLSTAFLASMTAAMLASTWTVEALGSRGAYILTLVVFILGSMLASFSPNDTVLIFARVAQGTAAGVAQPLGMVAIFQAFPADRRGTAMGIYGVGVVLAPALGPCVGGMLIDHYSWRYVFAVAVPLCIPAILLAWMFLPTRGVAVRRSFDWLGFLLLTTAIATFLTALANGQRIGWDSTFVDGNFALAAITLVGFVVREGRAPTPILALDVFLNPRFLAASIVAFSLGMGLYGSTYLVPLFVQTIQGYMPTNSGLLLLPGGLALGVVIPFAGRLSDKVAPHLLILLGLALFGASNVLMRDADVSTEFWTFAGWLILGRAGLGFILPSLNSGALRVLDQRLISHGAGAVNFMRQLGGAVGVNLLSVYLERQTTFYAGEFNALQTGTAADTNALHRIAMALGRAGLADNAHVALRSREAYRFLSRMIEAQAGILGYRESFLFVGVVFLAALVPAWFMRPKRHVPANPAGEAR